MLITDDQIAICSVAFGDNYIAQQNRLRESILAFHPGAKLYFWTDELPPASKLMHESLYGFKPHAVKRAMLDGYKYVFFFDPAIILVNRLDSLIFKAHSRPVIAVQDDTPLADVCSQFAVNYFNIRRSYLCGKHLVGGSYYLFNFNHPLAGRIFTDWLMAEKMGIFGSQQQAASEQLQGHRYDETCMALCLYQHNTSPMPYTGSQYDNDANAVIIKRHFK